MMVKIFQKLKEGKIKKKKKKKKKNNNFYYKN